MISESVRIKAEVVSADEKEGGLRRILNFGHTFGHALESETKYSRFLHGEAVAWGMIAATHLSRDIGLLNASDADRILRTIQLYGPIPSLDGIAVESLEARLVADKKSIRGKVHFVLADGIGHVVVRSDVPREAVLRAIQAALG
jgi:3-dehydroquinate synthase